MKFLVAMSAGEAIDRLIQYRLTESGSPDHEALEQIVKPLMDDPRLAAWVPQLIDAHQILTRNSENVRRYGTLTRLGSQYIAVSTGVWVYEDVREKLINKIDLALSE